MKLETLGLLAAAVLLVACESDRSAEGGPPAATPVAAPPSIAPRSAKSAVAGEVPAHASLEDAAARELDCPVEKLVRSGLSKVNLEVIDGCGRRAVYAPDYAYPGPYVVGFVLISKFATSTASH